MRKLILIYTLFFSYTALATGYPAHWWKPVPPHTAPSWEILPQEAGPGEVILSKRNELGGLLSNFAATPFKFDGVTYPSLEGFWQMMKYPEGPNDPRIKDGIKWPFTRRQVSQMSGFDAKKAGSFGSNNMKALNINWVSYRGHKMTYRTSEAGPHFMLIRRAMIAKLKQNPKVLKVLLMTGNLKLRPDHDQGKNPPPAWQYHNIWMKIRAELRSSAHR